MLIDSVVDGDVVVTDDIGGDLVVAESGRIVGRLRLIEEALVDGEVMILGAIDGGMTIGGRTEVTSGVVIGPGARVGEVLLGGDAKVANVRIPARATISRSFVVAGRSEVENMVIVGDGVRIGGDLVVRAAAEIGGLRLTGDASVSGSLSIGGQAFVGSDVWMEPRTSIGGDLQVTDAAVIVGALEVGGTVGGDLVVEGNVDVLRMNGVVSGLGRIAPLALTSLLSVRRGRFGGNVHVGDWVSIARCDLRHCGDLDKLELTGAHLLALPDGTQARDLANPPAERQERIPDGEMASIYRQLRVNLEGKGNRPASALFYRGEMDSRRRTARQQMRWTEWGWLSLYRVVSGYGLRLPLPSFGSWPSSASEGWRSTRWTWA